MVGIFEKFTQGYSRGTQLRQGQEDRTYLLQERARLKAKREKADRIGNVLIANMGPAGVPFLGGGREGAKAAGYLNTIQSKKRQDELRRKQAEEEAFTERAKNAYITAKAMPDDQKGKAYQAIIASAANGKFIDPQTADNLSRTAASDPVAFETVVDQIFGIKKPATKFRVYQDESGKTYNVDENSPSGRALLAKNPGWRVAPTREETGKPGSFNTKKVENDMDVRVAATTNFIADLKDMRDLIEKNPDALTVVGTGARIAANVMSNIKPLEKVFDSRFDNEKLLEVEHYSNKFKQLGIDNAVLQSIIIGVAAQQAILNNPRGVVSESDMKNAIEQTGASLQSAEGAIAVVNHLAQRAERMLKNEYKARLKKEFSGDLGSWYKKSNDTVIGGWRYVGPEPMTEQDRANRDNWERVN